MSLRSLMLSAVAALLVAVAAPAAAEAVGTLRVIGPDGRVLVRSNPQAGFAYPDDGSLLQVGDVARDATGALRLYGVSLLGGRLRMETATVGAGSAVTGLMLDGAALTARPNAVLNVAGVGYAVVLQEALVPFRDGRSRRTTVALRLHLLVATAGLPVGSDVLLGYTAGEGPTAPELSGAAAEVPAALVPIYRAAGAAYGVPWSVLAAVNRVETSFGRNLSVSSAGAMGWMQFMPGTWAGYGYDAGGDGRIDPNDPTDAIFSAARLLAANGAAHNLAGAVFLYNHSDRYVQTVLALAQAYAVGTAAPPPAQGTAGLDETRGFSPVALW